LHNERAGAIVSWTEVPKPDERGKQEMHELAVATFAALEEAGLTEALDQLHDRVFAGGPDALFDVEVTGDVWLWSFKPYVELLLRHIVQAASNSTLTPRQRQMEIATVLGLAGF
jgi:hypothetical protein